MENLRLSLLNNSQRKGGRDIVSQVQIQLQQKWKEYLQMYTDGWKDPQSGRLASTARLEIHKG